MTQLKSMMASVAFLFLFSFLSPAVTSAQQLNMSPALQTLLNQCDQAYLKAMNSNLDYALNNRPFALAGLLGVTMRRQLKYSAIYPQYSEHFHALNRECMDFLQELARYHNFQNPKDGSSLTDRMLIEKFSLESRGNSDKYFRQRYGIDPLTVNLPMMLAEVSLLGVTADGSESDSGYTPPKDNVVPEDFILGTWADPENRNNRVTFQRRGSRYEAYLMRQFTDRNGNPYTMTTVYTVLSSEVVHGIAGKNRVWVVHRKNVCNPQVNVWNCTKGSEKNYRLSLWRPTDKNRYYRICCNFIAIENWIKI